MKKVALFISLCLVAGSSFAQKKALKDAKNELKKTNANLNEARSLIKSALTDPETKDLAETWYVAGCVEDKQFEIEKIKEIEGGEPNKDLMFPALDRILPFFLVADSLDQLPDAKGNIKPKFRKDIKTKIQFNYLYYINAGQYYYEKEDFQKAHETYMLFGDIPKLPLFDGDPFQENAIITPEDTLVKLRVRYYAAIAADLANNHKAAIDVYNEIKDMGFNEDKINERLMIQYTQIQDTINLIKTLQEGVDKFNNSDYMLRLIDVYWMQNNIEEAKSYMLKALEITPDNPDLYNALASVYEKENEIDKEIATLEKALEVAPSYVPARLRLGLIYYNKGIDKRESMNDIKNRKAYEEGMKEVDVFFKQAIPYLEKAYELDNEEPNAILALRNVYYSLGMEKEYEKMEKIHEEKTK